MPSRGAAVVVLASRRRSPPEVMLLLLCLLSGVGYLAGSNPPDAVQSIMPAWLVMGWYGMLIIAGATGMVGNFWPGRNNVITAWRIRLAGQLFAAGPAAAYGLSAFAVAGFRALPLGGPVMAWCGICTWQAVLLFRDLSRLERAR